MGFHFSGFCCIFWYTWGHCTINWTAIRLIRRFLSSNSTACDSRHLSFRMTFCIVPAVGNSIATSRLVLAHLWTVVFQFVAYFIHPGVGRLQKRFFSTSLPMWFDRDSISHIHVLTPSDFRITWFVMTLSDDFYSRGFSLSCLQSLY